MDKIESLTENRNPDSYNIDLLEVSQIVELMNNEDVKVVEAVAAQKSNIAKVVELVIASLKNKGRLFYVGAGTSGRLGLLDAVECPPTYGTSPEMVQALLAGGDTAVLKAVEGAEDSRDNGKRDVSEKVKSCDVVVGIASSGSTPYVRGALEEARKIGASTALITCNKVQDDPVIDVIITLLTGPEIVTGSTRLKAGTATKMVLNMISTITMVKLGKVYGNLMIDLQVVNKKLQKRALGIIKTVTDLDTQKAEELLINAKGKVKIALAMYFLNSDYETARIELNENNGFLRQIIK